MTIYFMFIIQNNCVPIPICWFLDFKDDIYIFFLSQGLVISFLYCFLNAEVQSAILVHWTRWKGSSSDSASERASPRRYRASRGARGTTSARARAAARLSRAAAALRRHGK